MINAETRTTLVHMKMQLDEMSMDLARILESEEEVKDCYGCEYYDDLGNQCSHWGVEIPDEALKAGCDEWVLQIPF
jgi:hypothetical protein